MNAWEKAELMVLDLCAALRICRAHVQYLRRTLLRDNPQLRRVAVRLRRASETARELSDELAPREDKGYGPSAN